MSIQRTGIDNVRVIVLPDAVRPFGDGVTFSHAVLVSWQSSLEGLLYQVYINGRFAGVTNDPSERQLVIQTPSFPPTTMRVEVIAVGPHEAHYDFSGQIDISAVDVRRIGLTILRSQSLPAGAAINIYGDNGSGTIDYDTPVNKDPILVWPCWQDKAGFGMARFGSGDFGYDAAAAVGFGKGLFGCGQLGLDAGAIEWVSPVLSDGDYRFGVVVYDNEGNAGQAAETAPITLD